MRITAITPQKKRKNRFNIFIDGRFAFGLDTDNVLKYGLHANQEVSQEDINRYIKEDEFANVYNKALNFLSYRPRSKKEIMDYLHKQEVGEMTQQQILDKLEKLKLINDQEFARWFVSQRQAFRPKGKRLIELELRRKGIDQVTAQTTISEAGSDEVEQAVGLLAKKLPLWDQLPAQERLRKIQGYLGRRGYTWEVIKSVLGRLKAEVGTFDEGG